MYYPYFRARQFELIALRELAEENATQGLIIPVLEPVKKRYNSLDLAYKIFKKHSQQAYLIINPKVGDKARVENYYLDYFIKIENNNVYLPAFLYQENASYITNCIKQNNLSRCMIICSNDLQVNNDFRTLAELDVVSAIMVEDPGRNRQLDRYLRDLDKKYIRLDDLFEKQSRNSDFLEIEEHKFSEEHLFYKDEKFDGFSDYTVLPSEYIDSGSTPRAVVIHMTYLTDQDEVWIKHFTSITNDSITNIQGKFEEAARKAVTYFQNNKALENSAIRELIDYYDREHYPGLGVVKKISIKNHLLVVGDYLVRN